MRVGCLGNCVYRRVCMWDSLRVGCLGLVCVRLQLERQTSLIGTAAFAVRCTMSQRGLAVTGGGLVRLLVNAVHPADLWTIVYCVQYRS
jgi:hypothetical protein